MTDQGIHYPGGVGQDGTTIIGLLGPVAVMVAAAPDRYQPTSPADTDITVVSGLRAKRLLTSLALAGGRTRSADRLIDDVWGRNPPRSPGSALHTQISRLRPLVDPAAIEASGAGYRLVGCQTDLDIITDLARRDDALSLDVAAWWRGAAGDDLGGDATGRLDQELAARAAEVADLIDRRGFAIGMRDRDFTAAATIAERRCRADPLDESAHLDLMTALSAAGRTAEAIVVYARLRRALVAELGTEPGAQIAALHEQLLSGTGGPDPGQPARRHGRDSGLFSDTTELIGRDSDVAAIVALLTTHRVVTIQGPGGVGKTRVANRVGHLRVDAGDVVHYVPLAPVRNENDVVAAIASALGIGEAEITATGRPRLTVGDLTDRLLDAMRGRRALLILDNCEQVIDRCARLVGDLLASDPGVRVLVTSRSPLMLPVEQIYPLPILDVASGGAAAELFVARARSVRPGADLPADAVADLCRHLDGLPLAIELAAARLRTMTVDEIAARLTQRFALLRGADRSAPDRHRTLYAVIEWSWDLLDGEARTALRRLCRYPGGFTVAAAAHATGLDGVALDDALASVINQSLLEVTESVGCVRYRMLETVREFGEDKLAANPAESDDVRLGMRDWARGVAGGAVATYGTGVDQNLIGEIAADVENLVWVLRNCVEQLDGTHPVDTHRVDTRPVDADALDCVVRVFPVLAGFWLARGLHAEVMAWGTRLLRVLPTPPRVLDDTGLRAAWQATVLAAVAHQVMRRNLRALATGRYYLRILARPGQTYATPTDLLTACALAASPHAALRFIVRGARSLDPTVSTIALLVRMNLRENFGHLDAALGDALVLAARAESRDAWLSAMVQVSIGGIHGQQMRWQQALAHYRVGLDRLVRVGAYEEEMATRCYVVVTLIALGEFDDAATELATITDGWTPGDPDPQGGPELAAGMMLACAEYEFARGRHDAASALYGRSATVLRRDHPFAAGDPGVMMMMSVAAVGLMRSGAVDEAVVCLELLTDGVMQTYSTVGWHDSPQAGCMALAAGYVMTADECTHADAVRLLMLSRRLGARRDYPGLAAVDRDMREIAGLTDAEWDNRFRSVAQLSRRQAVTAVQTILASRRTADQALRM